MNYSDVFRGDGDPVGLFDSIISVYSMFPPLI